MRTPGTGSPRRLPWRRLAPPAAFLAVVSLLLGVAFLLERRNVPDPVTTDGISAADETGATASEEAEVRPSRRWTRFPEVRSASLVGRGAGQALVATPREGEPPYPTVVFLHGWGATDPLLYEDWLRHLLREGTAVVFAVYQRNRRSPSSTLRPAAARAIRSALGAEQELDADALVIAGYSAGGAVAVDLAATASDEGIPEPFGVLAVYPGRGEGRLPQTIPPEDASRIGPGISVVALAGARDVVAGRREAQRIAREAGNADYTLVTDPAVSHHEGPTFSSRPARRAFWEPLDELVEQAAEAGGARG